MELVTLRNDTLIELALLFSTVAAFLSLLVRSLITGDDIPSGWAYLIAMSWGGLLGVKEAFKRRRRDDGERGGDSNA